jgi:signal transduction histidine kinase
VTEASIVERLLAHRLLKSAPRDQLEWLAAHGTLERFEPGETVSKKFEPIPALYIVLSGLLSIYVDHGAGPRKVLEWAGGDVTGLLPYSRATTPPGNSKVEETAELLVIDRQHFPEMIRRCHEVTAILVGVMIDRARRFTTSELQTEKMVSLGRLAAGLAHELNNPASALARSARELSSRVFEMEAAALALGSMQLTAEQLAAIAKVRAKCDPPGGRAALSPLERADREEALEGWLSRHRLKGVTAEELAETSLTVETLDELAASLGNEPLEFALRSLCAGHGTRLLAKEVEVAAGRIHSLVAAIKGFTYMDQNQVAQPVAIGKGLTDTLAVLGSKARAKSVSISLRVPEDLPKVEALGGELNQVWANLIDNAIDAVPEAGHVEVSAAAHNESVVVRVVDNGPGVPIEIKEQIFDPFFTTKPVGSGTGLGLDIARRLIRQHHGQIEIDSRPGRTEFKVTLPRA